MIRSTYQSFGRMIRIIYILGKMYNILWWLPSLGDDYHTTFALFTLG